MRQDNRGFTLVELIIAMTISVLILGAATIFISSSLRSYTTASNTIDLQMESQIAVEQLSTWIMEGNAIYYGNGTDTGILVIMDKPTDTDSSKWPAGYTKSDTSVKTRVIWQTDNNLHMLYLDQKIKDDPLAGHEDYVFMSSSSVADVSNYTQTALDAMAKDENCLCEYVDDFVVEIKPVLSTGKHSLTKIVSEKVAITLKLKEGAQEHEINDEILVRNEIIS